MGMMMDIPGTVIDIDHKQSLAIAARALVGQVRAVELQWRTLVKARYGIAVAPFTARDRQNLKYLLSGFTIPEALRLMEMAVEHWSSMRREPYLAKLAPTPVFRDFFWMREHVQSYLVDMERRSQEQRRLNEQYLTPPPQPPDPETVPEEPGVVAPPRFSLTQMMAAAKKKLREERE